MRVLGVDQSFKKSGLVVLEVGNPDMVFREKFCSTDKSDDVFERSWIVASRVRDIVLEYNISKVVLEGLAFGSMGDNTRNLAGLQFTIVNMLKFGTCELRPLIEILSPQTLKKFATGSGKAKKEDMIAALDPKVRNIFLIEMGVKKTTGLDDMTDAYFLAKYGIEKIDNCF